MCLRAPCMLRFSPAERVRMSAPAAFTTSPITATTIIQPPRISGGSWMRW